MVNPDQVVGRAKFAPIVWGNEVIEMFNTAAHVRFMSDEMDLRFQALFRHLAAATWMNRGRRKHRETLLSTLPPSSAPAAS